MYEHLVQAYVRLLRQTSPQAARCVEKIEARYGMQVAVRAAFSLVLTMRRFHRTGQMSAIGTPFWDDSCVPGDRAGVRQLYDTALHALVADLTARR